MEAYERFRHTTYYPWCYLPIGSPPLQLNEPIVLQTEPCVASTH